MTSTDPATHTPFVAVIMAGGQGKRFWPLSTADRPKQFLDLEHRGRTMLQATFDRLLPITGTPERVYVATSSRYVPLVREQLPDLPGSNVIVEPTGRDSAPAVALACLALQERLGDVTLGFFSSDHQVEHEGPFQEAVRSAVALAEREAALVTLGVAPTRAATAYGYIERGDAVGEGYRVRRFVEKPALREAQAYVRSGDYLWNAGIFVWRSDVILAELDQHATDIMRPLRSAIANRNVPHVFPTLPVRSIDVAVMERTDRALVVPVDCGWDDVGDWVALERILQRSGREGATTVAGKHVAHQASGNIVYTEDEDDVVVTIGVHDVVVVKRGNTVLLVAKDRLDEVKAVLSDEQLTSKSRPRDRAP